MLSEIAGGRRPRRKNIRRGLCLEYGEVKDSILAWAKHRGGVVLPSDLPCGELKNRQILHTMAATGICKKMGPNTHGGKFEPQFVFSNFMK